MRKVLLTMFSAALAVIFIPGSPASAAISTGHAAGCYNIQKAGTYKDVFIGVTPHHGSGKNVYIYGYISTSVPKQCQHPNGVSISRISLYAVRLKDRHTGKVVRLTMGHSSYGSLVSAKTSNKYMHCGRGYIASVKVGYSYSDGSRVRPFYVSGGKFKRC